MGGGRGDGPGRGAAADRLVEDALVHCTELLDIEVAAANDAGVPDAGAMAALVDHGSTMQKVARLAVPSFADWCAVDVLVDPGSAEWPPAGPLTAGAVICLAS